MKLLSSSINCRRIPSSRIKWRLGPALFENCAAILWIVTSIASAGTPEWLREAAIAPQPAYPDQTVAVTLLREQVTTVRANGELSIRYRSAYKILRPEGRRYGTDSVSFDKEVRLLSFRGWCISKSGQDYEAKAKDAVETSLFNEDLYSDVRRKVLRMPSAAPGDVVGFESELSLRPESFEDVWSFQEQIPVLQARYELHLPPGWGYKASWVGHKVELPNQAGSANNWVWTLSNLPPIEPEPRMPAWRVLAGKLMIACGENATNSSDFKARAWADVGGKYARLTEGRRESNEEIRLLARELAGGSAPFLVKIRALARFVQREIRYVSIQIGIGSIQPHAATEIFAKRYGDCKDKATLLAAMLSAIGVNSYYVLVNSERVTIPPEFPSMKHFDHVILAISIPQPEAEGLPAVIRVADLGDLLLFDPTSTVVPVGELPAGEQGSLGLLIMDKGSNLVQLPLLSPPRNKLLRVARLSFSSDQVVSGEVEEVRWGAPAAAMRSALQAASNEEKLKMVEDLLTRIAERSLLQSCGWQGLENLESPLQLKYKFASGGYVKSAGDLILIRPQVFARQTEDLFQKKPRKYPVEFSATGMDAEEFEITIPADLEPEELPPPLDIETKLLSYHSDVTAKGQVIRATRRYQLKQPLIPPDEIGVLEGAYRQIAASEAASVVLKKKAQ
jgi:hypothetical protein